MAYAITTFVTLRHTRSLRNKLYKQHNLVFSLKNRLVSFVIVLKSSLMKCLLCVFTHCRVFKRYPEAKQLFTRVNVDDMDSPEFKAHLLRICNSLDLLVNFLNDRTAMMATAKHLADQHASRHGVSPAHFQVLPTE